MVYLEEPTQNIAGEAEHYIITYQEKRHDIKEVEVDWHGNETQYQQHDKVLSLVTERGQTSHHSCNIERTPAQTSTMKGHTHPNLSYDCLEKVS